MSCLPFKCRAWPHYLPRIVQSVFPACEHCDLERAVLNPVVAKMASSKWAGILVALLLTLSVATASISNDIDRRRRDEGDYERRDRHEPRGYELKGEGERERELHLEEPQEVFSSEGGDLKVWSRIRYLEDSDVFVTAARLRLRNRGLLLPKYTDVAAVAYVEEGEGLLGFLSGYNLGERVRRVRRGDVVALPRGVAHWWYNGGEEDLRILALADTTGGLRPGEYSVRAWLMSSCARLLVTGFEVLVDCEPRPRLDDVVQQCGGLSIVVRHGSDDSAHAGLAMDRMRSDSEAG